MAQWIHTVFDEPSCRAGLPDDSRSDEWVNSAVVGVQAGRIVALMPVVDDTAAGLFFGSPWENGTWSVHQFVMPRFRGWPAFCCARACAEAAFREVPGCEWLMGFTPVENRPALVCAKRAGFERVGTMPRYQLIDGERVDCAIMVRGRNGQG